MSVNVNYLVEPRGPFAQFVCLILFLSFSGSPWDPATRGVRGAAATSPIVLVRAEDVV